jgi:hypothetical protein
MALGWIYIFSNSAMPGLLKIGYSNRDPELRIKEIDGTGIPIPFSILYWAMVNEPYSIEQSIHQLLSEYRINKDREFFKLSDEEALDYIKEYLIDNEIEIVLEKFFFDYKSPKLEHATTTLKTNQEESEGFINETNQLPELAP